MGKVCSFTGHRLLNDKDEISKILFETVEHKIQDGFDHFLCGGAIGFDTVAGEVVLGLREKHPIKLELVLPCKDQDKGWSAKDRSHFEYLLSNADKIRYITDNYYDGCMQARNVYLVDNADLCIAYLVNQFGGTYFTVNYALKNNLEVINIANIIK